MFPYSLRVRLLLGIVAASILAAGALFTAQARVIPWGHWFPSVAILSLLAAAVPAAILVRFQVLTRRLLHPRFMTLPAGEIPRRPDHTYMGEGFSWGPRETRLLAELSASGISPAPEMQDRLAGDWMIHGIGAGRTGPLFFPDALLNQHLFLMGAPGSGKTRGLELLVEQAVARGDAVVVIDPKGDEGLLDRTYDSAVRHGREAAFRVLALPYPYQSARYNPLSDYVSPSDVADRIASILPRRGDSEPFRNFAWHFTNIVASALDRIGERVSVQKLENYAIHNTWLLVRLMIRRLCPGLAQGPQLPASLDAYRHYCATNKVTFPELDALIDMAQMDREYFGKITGSLRTILAKLSGRTTGTLLCPDDADPSKEGGETAVQAAPVLSWRGIDNRRLVVYFFLGSLIGQDTASATARMALADLASYVGKKYAYEEAAGFATSRLTVIVDEVADALAPESVNVLNKARGAGLSLVMAGQSLADLEVALGSQADARRALANMGSFLTLRAANPDDARFFTEKVGRRPILEVTRGDRYEPALFSSGRSNIADFSFQSSTNASMRSDYLLPKEALDRLGRFHYFGLWAGGLQKGVLPVLDPPLHRFSPRLKDKEAGGGARVAAPSTIPVGGPPSPPPPVPLPAGEVRS